MRTAAERGYTETDPRDDLSCLDMKRKLVTTAREIIGMADLETNTLPCESLLPEAVRAWAPDTSEGAASLGAQLAEQLRPYDDEWARRVQEAQASDKVLKYVGRLDAATGEAGLAIEAVHQTHQLALCSGMQNTIVVFSNRCGPHPLTPRYPRELPPARPGISRSPHPRGISTMVEYVEQQASMLPSSPLPIICSPPPPGILRYGADETGGPLVLQGPAAGHELKAMGMFTDVLRLSRTLAEWTIPKIL